MFSFCVCVYVDVICFLSTKVEVRFIGVLEERVGAVIYWHFIQFVILIVCILLRDARGSIY